MMLVNLHKTWPMVMAGTKTPDEATFYAWPIRPEDEAAFKRHGDVVLGIFLGRVVTAYDITSHRAETSTERDHERRQGLGRHHARVVLEGLESETWRHLVDGPSPGMPFTQWPVHGKLAVSERTRRLVLPSRGPRRRSTAAGLSFAWLTTDDERRRSRTLAEKSDRGLPRVVAIYR